MDERLIKSVDLENGLRLEVVDSSQKVAGDRWQVVLTFRTTIPVNMLSLVDSTQAALNPDEVMSAIGETVSFEQKRERNFIDANKKDEILNSLIESFLSNAIDYVSNPDFPKRYIISKYKDYLRRKSWYPKN